MTTLRLYENLRTVSYAPFYLADQQRLFEQFDLDVEIIPSPSPPETAAGLIAGRVDVAWGGPMRVMYHHDQDPNCPLVCFGKVVGPEPFSLVGQEPRADFRLRDLLGLTIGLMTDVPTPWLTLQDDLLRAGIQPNRLTRAPARTQAENVLALANGEVDVIQVMEPYTQAAVNAGGYVWHPFATRGDVVFTSFYTTRQYATTHPEACQALSRTMQAALSAILSAPSIETAEALQPWFPDLTKEHLANSIQRYLDTNIWSTDTTMTISAFTRLKGALLSAGFINSDVPYQQAVVDHLSN